MSIATILDKIKWNSKNSKKWADFGVISVMEGSCARRADFYKVESYISDRFILSWIAFRVETKSYQVWCEQS